MIRSICLSIAALMLASCASQVTDDQAISLQPDQGLAAVVLNAPDRIRQIAYQARDPGGHDFEVPDTSGGATLYLTPAKAGRYCLKHMRYGRIMFNSKGDIGCFTVVAGHITYGGEIIPMLLSDSSPNAGPGLVDRRYEQAQFSGLLQGFPKLATAYPVAAAAPPPAGVEPPSLEYPLISWVKQNDDHTQTIYLQNNTAWRHRLQSFGLYDCSNVRQSCVPAKVDMVFAPFEVKQILVVEPADTKQGFSYRFNYESLPMD